MSRLGRGRPRHEEGKKALLQALTVLAFLALSLVPAPPPLQPEGCWHLHLTDEKTEAQRGCGQAGNQQNWD